MPVAEEIHEGAAAGRTENGTETGQLLRQDLTVPFAEEGTGILEDQTVPVQPVDKGREQTGVGSGEAGSFCPEFRQEQSHGLQECFLCAQTDQ